LGCSASGGKKPTLDSDIVKRPDISILSDDFLDEIRGMKQKNLAAELMAKLLMKEIKIRMRSNVAQSRSFANMLEATVRKYQNRAVETALLSPN
jgi:type I restriction enzyme, R subunit